MREALEADPRFEVCAEAADAAAAIDAAVRQRPDVCLLDIEMPGGGIGAAWEISARVPDARIVMLTVSTEEEHLFAALRAGASGYLLKDIDLARLPQALHDVMRGEAAIPRTLVALLVEEFRDRGPRWRSLAGGGSDARLTSREWEVLDLMRRGLSTAEIAEKLVLAPATVRTHIAAILRKLRVADREEALRLFGGPA